MVIVGSGWLDGGLFVGDTSVGEDGRMKRKGKWDEERWIGGVDPDRGCAVGLTAKWLIDGLGASPGPLHQLLHS